MKSILYVADAASIHTRRWAECYRDRGLDVHIASFRSAIIPGVKVHKLPNAGLGKAGYFLAIPVLKRIVKALNPDVVHAQYVTSYGFLAAIAKLKPLVLTAWGSDVLLSPNESRVMRYFVTYALRSADVVTTVAEHMKGSVAALGVPIEKIIAVPFGVDSDLFIPPVLPRPDRKVLRLISTRNFYPIYDIDTLVDAVNACIKQGILLNVDLVGVGPLSGELKTKVRRLGLSDKITFHGHVDHIRLAALLAEADMFVSSSLSDGNNVSLNEAMSCGCFPIATKIPANTQWISHGENGLLYRPRDYQALSSAIESAAHDKIFRDNASVLNRQIILDRADWRICVANMDNIYKNLIKNIKSFN